jgi:hypothetical protein
MWLPALGAALFVAAGLWWAVSPAAAPVVAEPAPSASAPVTPPPPPVPVASAVPPPPPPASAVPPFDGRLPQGAPAGGPAAAERMRRVRQPLQLKGAGGQP